MIIKSNGKQATNVYPMLSESFFTGPFSHYFPADFNVVYEQKRRASSPIKAVIDDAEDENIPVG